MTTFRFIQAEKANFPIAFMCRHLGVSRSGYHAWATRPPSRRAVADQVLLRHIRTIHQSSRGTYGAPRIHAELRFAGMRCSRKRVARLMRGHRIQGIHVRRPFRTTRRASVPVAAHDLVERSFDADRPNVLWASDITYCRTAEGYVYLAAIVDCYSRRVVGWAMAPHLRTELVADALEMALRRRRPSAGLIHHSDHGCQYTSLAFSRRLRLAGLVPSMGSVGDAYDNAVVESFFGTLKRELVHRHRWTTRQELVTAVFAYIEGFYNRRRRHSFNGHLSPAQFEERYAAGALV